MTLCEYRNSLGLSQEECAKALGLKSKGHISEIEAGSKNASPLLAMRIQKWSRGKVPAADLSPVVAEMARMKPGKAA